MEEAGQRPRRTAAAARMLRTSSELERGLCILRLFVLDVLRGNGDTLAAKVYDRKLSQELKGASVIQPWVSFIFVVAFAPFCFSARLVFSQVSGVYFILVCFLLQVQYLTTAVLVVFTATGLYFISAYAATRGAAFVLPWLVLTTVSISIDALLRKTFEAAAIFYLIPALAAPAIVPVQQALLREAEDLFESRAERFRGVLGIDAASVRISGDDTENQEREKRLMQQRDLKDEVEGSVPQALLPAAAAFNAANHLFVSTAVARL